MSAYLVPCQAQNEPFIPSSPFVSRAVSEETPAVGQAARVVSGWPFFCRSSPFFSPVVWFLPPPPPLFHSQSNVKQTELNLAFFISNFTIVTPPPLPDFSYRPAETAYAFGLNSSVPPWTFEAQYHHWGWPATVRSTTILNRLCNFVILPLSK